MRLAVWVFGMAVCSFALTGCAEDWDDFFTKQADDIAARDAEDAAIRADLAEEIANLETEITGKIANVEGKLHDLIEQGGTDVLSDLATKSQQTRSTIDTRYAQFTALMDTKFGAFQTTANNLFTQFATKRQQLEQELNQAIAQNNTERAAEVQQFINDVKAMQQSVQGGVQQINALQTEYAALFAQADKLLELEQRAQTQAQRFEELYANLTATLKEAEGKYEAQKETNVNNLSTAEIQDYKDKLADMSSKLTQMQAALAKLEEMKDDAEQLVSDFSDLVDCADGMSSLISEIESAYESYSKAEDILNRIDGTDISSYEDMFQDLQSDLEQANHEMEASASSLGDTKDAMETTRDDLLALVGECEFYAGLCETLAEEIHIAFDSIPFP